MAERIYVLNNGCVDGEPHVPDGRRRETVIESPTNLGYAAGVNLLVSARVKREIGGFDAT